MTQQKLLTPKVRREIYWILHWKLELFLTGALPCIVWCGLVYVIIGHLADVHGFNGVKRIDFYRALELIFMPGSAWFLWRCGKHL